MIVIKQQATGFIVFAAGGLMFLLLPWFQWLGWLWLAISMPLGALALTGAIYGWCHQRIGMVIDCRGLWCSGFSHRGPVLVPWDEIVGARYVAIEVPFADLEGVLIGLRSDAANPLDARVRAAHRKQQERWLGPVEWPSWFFLSESDWNWRPREIAELIQGVVADPAKRAEFGSFESQSRTSGYSIQPPPSTRSPS